MEKIQKLSNILFCSVHLAALFGVNLHSKWISRYLVQTRLQFGCKRYYTLCQSLGIPLEGPALVQLYASNAIDLIWAARNHVVHGGLKCDALVLAHRVKRVSMEHKAAWQNKLQVPRLHE